MTTALKPIFLVSDSYALFSAYRSQALVKTIRATCETDDPKAAYIGASNGDDPLFYTIFEAAMDLAGIQARRMVRATFTRDDVAVLESADLILLGGGNPAAGWRALESGGVLHILRDRYYAGAVLVGVSAGAMLFGEKGFYSAPAGSVELFNALRLVPWIIEAHDEAQGWSRLQRAITESGVRGLGLPAGSGVIFHPDNSLEPIHRPILHFMSIGNDEPQLLIPRGDDLATRLL